MDPLTPTQRRDLRAKAHHLEPVVMVGQHGLTPAVLHEIDVALLAHDLVKVRVFSDDRDAREAMLAKVCAALDCAPVQHVGKVLVLWRPNPERPKPKAPPPRPTARKKPSVRTPVDPVRERRRGAARPRQEPEGPPRGRVSPEARSAEGNRKQPEAPPRGRVGPEARSAEGNPKQRVGGDQARRRRKG